MEEVRRASTVVLLTVALCLAIAGTFIFGYRAGRHAHLLRWENEPIRPWMSVPFIAHTHHVPAHVLYAAIGLEPRPHDRRPLRAIAREQDRTVDDLIRNLEHALAGAGHVHPAPEASGGRSP